MALKIGKKCLWGVKMQEICRVFYGYLEKGKTFWLVELMELEYDKEVVEIGRAHV